MFRTGSKQLYAEKKILFTGIVLLCISLFAMLTIQLYGYQLKKCFLDAFCWASWNMPISIYPLMMFVSIVLTRDEFQANRVLRWKKQHALWLYVVWKTGLIALILSLAVFGITSILGLGISTEFCNWSELGTMCSYVLGRTLENVNGPAVMLVYFLCVFAGGYAVSMVPVFTYWLCGSYIPGAILGVFICAGGDGVRIDYNSKRGVFYTILESGIDIRYQFLLPMCLVLALAVGGVLYGKREYLSKGGRDV